ncbi:MAG: hypothetical protein P4M00_15895 [Azospirillaceae bacterium]|nr:hypothetical protein [Azospirillaceae bacterium]
MPPFQAAIARIRRMIGVSPAPRAAASRSAVAVRPPAATVGDVEQRLALAVRQIQDMRRGGSPVP